MYFIGANLRCDYLILLCCFDGQRYYLTSARELMRMNGTTKAPIVNSFGETISGAMTIRAFDKINQFKSKNLQLVDMDASLFFHTFIAYEWLVLRLETLCAIILCTSAFLMVVLPADSVDGGNFLATMYQSCRYLDLSQFQLRFTTPPLLKHEKHLTTELRRMIRQKCCNLWSQLRLMFS